MVRLKLCEHTDDRMVFQMGALVMLGHMTLCIVIVAAVSVSLTLFLRHYFGILAFILVGLPGILGVICGLFGCANARQFTFTFDRQTGEFTAAAGGAKIVKPLHEVRLVHIERECHSGSTFGGDSAPSYAAALLFADGTRCRLEGGVSISGTGRGPEELRQQAESIREFLRLPQLRVPLLDVRQSALQPDEQQMEAGLSRWLTCQGIAPRLEPPLTEYTWVEAPEGPVLLPPLRGRTSFSQYGPYGPGSLPPTMPSRAALVAAAAAAQGQNAGRVAPVVVGQVVQAPEMRIMQVLVPENAQPGQSIAVQAPDGTQVQTVVPANARPGQALTIQYCANGPC